MENVLDVFKQRGLLKQTVYEDELYEKLGKESVTFYIGFDPTADSLHIGHFVQFMVIKQMLKYGHKAIILLGGGTGMVGDPTDKTQMRELMTTDVIDDNCRHFVKQMSKYLDFNDTNCRIVNNADWLRDLNYISFLREIGVYFSVNKMLTAECYRSRMEKGLSFLELNYMLMQAYDFLMLNRLYGCQVELGGDDQWSNILAGADLIRRKEQKPAYAMTFALLENKEGKKMGKTSSGAIWLDENKTTPYEFYQYWRNIDDADVAKTFKVLTFLPVEEIEELTKYNDERMNMAKVRLAYEITKIIHGESKAQLAKQQAEAAFNGATENMQSITLSAQTVHNVIDVLIASKFALSKGEAKRLIEGGGVSIDDHKITQFDQPIPQCALDKGEFVIHKGKKNHLKIVLE
ncbi:MAG: tyrosine--tRNA ligase [Clostridia bacterium]|nr:tyrosine--tRNA ligase [Clostridia bacterium]